MIYIWRDEIFGLAPFVPFDLGLVRIRTMHTILQSVLPNIPMTLEPAANTHRSDFFRETLDVANVI